MMNMSTGEKRSRTPSPKPPAALGNGDAPGGRASQQGARVAIRWEELLGTAPPRGTRELLHAASGGSMRASIGRPRPAEDALRSTLQVSNTGDVPNQPMTTRGLSVVLPAWNEEAVIARTVQAVVETLSQADSLMSRVLSRQKHHPSRPGSCSDDDQPSDHERRGGCFPFPSREGIRHHQGVMQERMHCPACKQTGPVLTRRPLHRNSQGQLADGGIHAWGAVLGSGLFLTLLATGELLINGPGGDMVPSVLVWGPAVLGGLLILAASIGWVVIGCKPVAAYTYTCKGCGQHWQKEVTA